MEMESGPGGEEKIQELVPLILNKRVKVKMKK